jgi:UDP:flavonoid glycosyltransferase YjiC (YdhE family)
MRVLFTCQPALPHLYPLVPLAWACRSAGHEVRIASEAKIVEQIVHTGLHAVELPTVHKRAPRIGSGWSPPSTPRARGRRIGR